MTSLFVSFTLKRYLSVSHWLFAGICNVFVIYHDAIDKSNAQIKPLTQCKQTFSLLLLTLKPGLKCHIWKNRMGKPVSAESHFACHDLINAGLAKLWKSLEDNGLSKNGTFQYHPSCPLVDQFIYHQSHVRWNPHQLHLNSVLAQAPADLNGVVVSNADC
jgi:hypothetical protein